MTPKQQKRLDTMHDEFKEAEARFQMALQTFQGAQVAYQTKKIRFESAIEFIGGLGATWTFNPEDGVAITEALVGGVQVLENGQGASVPHHNHETRRAAKKALGK